MRAARARRVVLVEDNRDGTVGGSFQCVHDIARHLERSRYTPVAMFWEENRFADALRGAGIEVHFGRKLFTAESPPDRRRGLVARMARLAAGVLRRRRFLRAVGADLLHLNNSPAIGCDNWLPAARLTGLPIVTHARAEMGRPVSPIGRRLVGGFDRIIAISDYVAGTLASAGIPRRRVVRIYDGIDLDAVRQAGCRPRADTRDQLQVPADAYLILMAGNLKRWKGQHVLLNAISRLPPGLRSRCYTALAGASPPEAAAYGAELRELAARYGIADRVLFLGPRGDVPALMTAADVVVHASTRPEPFGLVVVEAMALGRAVIASAAGGPAETVSPGTGELFDPSRPEDLARTLERLLGDEPTRRRLGEAAAVRAETFSIQRNVAAIETVYAEVLGDAPGARTAP
ncbi:MAG TPA: glycosyltransferase family 4 protein [Gemmatimonadales bacterium]|nr:glycosyltransferase family 4 protein [Gemmatimonadales bacterium]